MKYQIEVYNKPEFSGSGEGIIKSTQELGINGLTQAKDLQIYQVEGNLNHKDLVRLCKGLLVDPITQTFSLNKSAKFTDIKTPYFSVEVWFKKGVTDPVGDSVVKAANDMGIKGVKTVKSGQKYLLKGNVKENLINILCQRLLANVVVQEYVIKEVIR